jgi:hypothetical protein
MADRYWVGGNGTWNGTNTTNWSTTSGGPGGASVPTALDAVFFNTSSGTSGNTVTVATVNPTCFSLSQTSGSPGINGNGTTIYIGDSAGRGAGSGTVTTAGSFFSFGSINLYGNTVAPASSISITSTNSSGFLTLDGGLFNLTSNLSSNNLRVFLVDNASLDLTSRTITVDIISVASGGSLNLTGASVTTQTWTLNSGVTANTNAMTSLTIPMFAGTSGAFSDRRTTTTNYPSLTLGAGNGGAVTVNVPNNLSVTALTIRNRGVSFTGGQTTTAASVSVTTPSTNPYALLTAITGTGQFTLSSASVTPIALNGLIISGCNATGGATFTAGVTSIDAGNNTGIQFANSPGFLAFFT